jgi:hypothetical protein
MGESAWRQPSQRDQPPVFGLAVVTKKCAENAPQPNRTDGPSVSARRTRNLTGTFIARREWDRRHAELAAKFLAMGGRTTCTPLNQALQQTAGHDLFLGLHRSPVPRC